MNVGNWISFFGGVVEIGGFAYLGWELYRTNTSAIAETSEFADQKADFSTIELWDGARAGGYIRGGKIGKLVKNLNARQADLAKSKSLIVRGLIWTGIGIAVQTTGTLLQALGV